MFKNIMFQIASTLLAVAVIAYLILHTVSSFENELEVKSVYYTTMDLTFDSTGYVFRDETVLSSNHNGLVLYEFDNGEKVKKNQKIASMYSDSSDFETRKKIQSLESEVNYLTSIVNEVKYSTPSIPELDKNINERIQSVSSFAFKNDLKNSIKVAKESIQSLDLKYCILNGTDEYEDKIEEYKKEISNLNSTLKNVSTSSISAPCSGYFYDEVDGYESVFTFENIDNLSGESFDNLKNTSPESISSLGKIVKSSKWYIVFELDVNDAITFSPDNKYSVTFPSSDNKIEMKLEKRIDSSDESKKILIMSSNAILDNFNFSRKQVVSITVKSYSGLAFPSSAIHTDYDSTGASKAGVYVLDETVVKFKTFTRIMEKNGYVLCALPDSKNISFISNTEVSLFDAVITQGTNLYHNKVIKNVLKVN